MILVLNRDWEVIDADLPASDKTNAVIPAGRHEVERIPNPFGFVNADWLVLVGTKIGVAEMYWRHWTSTSPANQSGETDHPDEWLVSIEE